MKCGSGHLSKTSGSREPLLVFVPKHVSFITVQQKRSSLLMKSDVNSLALLRDIKTVGTEIDLATHVRARWMCNPFSILFAPLFSFIHTIKWIHYD